MHFLKIKNKHFCKKKKKKKKKKAITWICSIATFLGFRQSSDTSLKRIYITGCMCLR